MVRRTVNLPESTDELVRELAGEGESFSAAVTRLIEAGAKKGGAGRVPRYVGTAQGERDWSRRVEEYLRNPVKSR